MTPTTGIGDAPTQSDTCRVSSRPFRTSRPTHASEVDDVRYVSSAVSREPFGRWIGFEESFSSAISGAVRETSTRVWHRCGGWESITLRAQFTSRSRSTLQETVARRGAVASAYRFVSRWGHLPPSPKCLDQGVS